MEKYNKIVRELRYRFTWVSDGKVDSYHILAADGQVVGDCDDFAITVLAELVQRQWLKMLWWLVSGKAKFWLVLDPKKQRHVTLQLEGIGYTDNWKYRFTSSNAPHEELYRVYWPVVLWKLLIGMWDKT